MTGRQYVKRQLLGFLVTCLMSAAVLVGMLLWAGPSAQGVPSSPTSEPSPASEPSPSRAQRLVEAHGCWTGPAPADMRDRVPGHVVVTTRADRTVLGGTRLVRRALDQAFGDKPAGLEIHAFCR